MKIMSLWGKEMEKLTFSTPFLCFDKELVTELSNNFFYLITVSSLL